MTLLHSWPPKSFRFCQNSLFHKGTQSSPALINSWFTWHCSFCYRAYHALPCITCAWMFSCFSRVQLFAIPWTVALQAPLTMGFSRQEHWSGLPCPPPEDLPDPGTKPTSLTTPASIGRQIFFTTSAAREASPCIIVGYKCIYRQKIENSYRENP